MQATLCDFCLARDSRVRLSVYVVRCRNMKPLHVCLDHRDTPNGMTAQEGLDVLMAAEAKIYTLRVAACNEAAAAARPKMGVVAGNIKRR